RLQQLFSNLLENTLRYADSPGTLKIWQERTENRLVLYFEDSGPGVPEEALARLFDRLYRVDKSRSRTRGGSGLGLSICQSIANALGGKIRAANAVSGGLRIEIELPMA
ncbi:MAG: PAS domain-containing sensor histidine kinase, partial [Desulfobacterales bacterium]|nr:PAS domain-containing sensor histidine kinase [Desulfobacterales bacterium]